MAVNYYAKIVLAGTSTPQSVQVRAASTSEAKKLIEAQFGKVKSWRYQPTIAHGSGNPPGWWNG